MKYIRLKWNHTNPDEPVYIFSELDASGKEIRKIECFRNGFCDIADADRRSAAAGPQGPHPRPRIQGHGNQPGRVRADLDHAQVRRAGGDVAAAGTRWT